MHAWKFVSGMCLGASLLLTAPAYGNTAVGSASAITNGVTTAPLAASARVVDAHSVRISGRTPTAHGRVRIERRASGGWHLRTWARVRHHRFQRELTEALPAATYRVVDHGAHSRSLSVRLRTTKPAQTASNPPATDACGVRPTKADGSLWSCTFDDEFSGSALDRTKWIPQTQFLSGTDTARACYRDDPANVSVGDGTLALTVRKEAAPLPCAALPGQSSLYTGGMVSTYHRFSQQYGRFEVRMKSPTYSGPGLQDDFWLWPDDRYPSSAVWPAAGEIDVVEHYSSYAGLNIPFLHYGSNANLNGVTTAWNCAIRPGVFNTYTLTWAPTRLEIDVNGAPCLINTSGDVAFQKPYIVALTQGLGAGLNGLTPLTPLPATLRVDYVRVWG